MPATRDMTAWQETPGDHGNDVTYQRLRKEPGEKPTDELRTEAEANPEINATQGALEAAEELGVDIASIEGTGAEGRVTKADVEAASGD